MDFANTRCSSGTLGSAESGRDNATAVVVQAEFELPCLETDYRLRNRSLDFHLPEFIATGQNDLGLQANFIINRSLLHALSMIQANGLGLQKFLPNK